MKRNINNKVVKQKSIIKEVKRKDDKIIPYNSFVTDDFIKVNISKGQTTYLLSNRIEFVDTKNICDNAEKPDEKHTHWVINYALINGEEILDVTPYKTREKAEKVAENIIRRLPKSVPITSITNNISSNSELSNDIIEPIGEQKPYKIGFRLDGNDE